MTQEQSPSVAAELARVVQSARRFGVELDETDALKWLQAIASWQGGGDVALDMHSGIFGHKVVMLDFNPLDLARFRAIGRLVEFENQPGVVETALALSGSAAQGKIQTYPGDCDYFERVNIKAPTRQEACRILGCLMRDKALSTLRGPTYQLIEVKYGNYPSGVVLGSRAYNAGSPIAWHPAEIQAGQIECCALDGAPLAIRWDDITEPGWCKLDWVVVDPVRGQLANASNMLDVTWEAPDGTILPLDGYLDPYFQEVYLEAESIPIFSKLARHVSADALDHYVEQLENEVRKYLSRDLNYGKVAKRMYNIFRLTGRYEEAAYLRELFDEPATMLYQVWSLIRTMDDVCRPGTQMTTDQLIAQADALILNVVEVLEGAKETEVVRLLRRLRDALTRLECGQGLTAEAEAARAEVINIVNNFFYARLCDVPAIKSYMDDMRGADCS